MGIGGSVKKNTLESIVVVVPRIRGITREGPAITGYRFPISLSQTTLLAPQADTGTRARVTTPPTAAHT